MPVGIAQILNATGSAIIYENKESKFHFIMPRQTAEQDKNDILCSSDTTDDTLPWYDSGRDDKYILIYLLGTGLKLSERDGTFYVYIDSQRHASFGSLTNGTRYVLRFDHQMRPHGNDGLRITVYKYEDPMKSSSDGEVRGAVLKGYQAIAATVFLLDYQTGGPS